MRFASHHGPLHNVLYIVTHCWIHQSSINEGQRPNVILGRVGRSDPSGRRISSPVLSSPSIIPLLHALASRDLLISASTSFLSLILKLDAPAFSIRREHLFYASYRRNIDPTISALFPSPYLEISPLLLRSAVISLIIISTRPLSLSLDLRDH